MRFKIILAVLLAVVVFFPIRVEAKNECADVKVLMYHHVRDAKSAKDRNQTGLNVTPEFFEKHMQYLKDKGYNVIGMDTLINFLDTGAKLPSKPVVITFDDGYEDNYLSMYPILRKFGFKATIFTITGLVENPDYLKWSQIDDMKNSGLVTFANHTWSHHPSSGTKQKQELEIGTANKQLAEKGLNSIKAFAYPYGNSSKNAKEVLQSVGYKIAFTTKHGTKMCSSNRFDLPRVRVGNASLKNYGL